ncbi:RNA polymerase sigma-70 factor (ECF subfamily) [Sphingobacterium allocomposti]|uniref:RNA polymerase sigma-70 factor (ECF subfamily) n=1 Tax=Sphingobacterium allocomposti TaxID=415956 RepID=A0A5S5D8A5_9SPHI|nr:sigma-70 family RNA polymerase sigma factor [Sphingobacterium composti Yoo et al. 2007 non Ten et al. 2007]TYP92307.1 RNA polymerase sigma-70 factor (ECF subfamily) [Sphingobacterium composti Yoo et al. 2007 non Ten et al. 2007]
MQILDEKNTADTLSQNTALTLQEFDDLYLKFSDAVYANIFKLVKRPDDAEDILQDVFVALWESRYKLINRSIGGWLFVVSHHKAMDHLKRQVKQSFEQIYSDEELPDQTNDSEEKETVYLEQMKMIKEAVEALPERKRQVFQLCRLDGRSKDEVAELMGISVNSVADYLKQSNKAIKEYILEHYPRAIATGLLVVMTVYP